MRALILRTSGVAAHLRVGELPDLGEVVLEVSP
jgi:hypothetical protein